MSSSQSKALLPTEQLPKGVVSSRRAPKKTDAPAAEATEVEQKLLAAEQAYFETGRPIIDDAEYDALVEVAQREGAVGARPVGFRPMGEKQVVLPAPMPSLDKIKPGEKKLVAFLAAPAPRGYVISEKLDGVSALWCRKGSATPRLFQRGDQQVGVEVTSYSPYVSGLADLPVAGAVRGEIVLLRSEGVRGPADRSIVNGFLHRSDPEEAVNELPGKLVFIGYEVISPRMARAVQMKWMADHGFETAWNMTITDGKLSEEYLMKVLQARRAESQYATDGIVVGRGGVPAAITADMKCPVDCVAFKMPLEDQMAETTVVIVEWNKSRHGYLVPRIAIEPVEIGGVIISWVTGHNAQWCSERGIGDGARVIVRRSGDVIPIIDSVLEVAETTSEPAEPWHYEGVHAVPDGEAEAAETDPKHWDHMMTQLGVKQFGPSRLAAMKEAGAEDFAHMMAQDEAFWVAALGKGIGPKLRGVVGAAVEAANRKQMLACYPWPASMVIGTRRIVAAEDFIEGRVPLPLDPLRRKEVLTSSKPDGFAMDSWVDYLDLLPAAEAWCEEQFGRELPELEAAAIPVTKKKAAAAQAKGVICITGFRDAALQAKLEAAGYTVANLSGKTTILLVKDAGESNNKVKEGKERGIRIVAKAEAEKELLA
jgi:NAD-dependent DNA ligase